MPRSISHKMTLEEIAEALNKSTDENAYLVFIMLFKYFDECLISINEELWQIRTGQNQ